MGRFWGRAAAAAIALAAVVACTTPPPDADPSPLRAELPTQAPHVEDATANDKAPLCIDASAGGAVEKADEILAGKVTLSPHPAVDLPDDPDWTENPLQDANWEFQYHALRWLRPLKTAWDQTGDQKYLDRYVELLHDWAADNPVASPPSAFSWNDHSTAHRAMVYACAVETMPDEAWLRSVAEVHGAVLADPEFYVGFGNHALNQNTGLVAVGCVSDHPEWSELGADRTAQLLGESVDEQGVTNEQSVGYQLYNLTMYRTAEEYLTACGLTLPEEFDRLDAMPEFLAHATLPNGTYETLGDTDVNPAQPIDGTPAQFAATRGAEGERPDESTAMFDQEGFLFGRTGWGKNREFSDEVFYSLRFGALPRTDHGHYDGASVTLYGFGRRLVLDPGKYKYQEDDPIRVFVRSREGHNVVAADGGGLQDVPTELVGHRSDESADVTVVRQETPEGVNLERTVVFSRQGGFLLVEDAVTARGPTTFRQLWHLAPGAGPTVAGSSVTTHQDRGNVAIYQLADQPSVSIVEGQTDPVQGWISEEYGTAIPAPVAEASVEGERARFVTLLVPFAETPPDVSWEAVGDEGEGLVARVTIDGVVHEVYR